MPEHDHNDGAQEPVGDPLSHHTTLSASGSRRVVLQAIHPAQPTKRWNGYGLIRVYRVVDSPDSPQEQPITIQVDIERDFYDKQSCYRTCLLTDRGWVLVHFILPESPDMAALPRPGQWSRDPDECIEAVEQVTDRLLSETCAVLGLL